MCGTRCELDHVSFGHGNCAFGSQLAISNEITVTRICLQEQSKMTVDSCFSKNSSSLIERNFSNG